MSPNVTPSLANHDWEISNQYSLIKRWYNKAKHQRNYFDKFISLWISFNAYYAHKDLEKTEQKQLQEFLQNHAAEFNGACNQVEFSDFKCHIDTKSRNKGYIQDLRYEKNTDREIRNRKYYSTVTNFEQYIDCVYQVRCNLFHGGKNLEDGQDEEIVKLAFKSLLKLITAVYNKESIL
jgi:hypothetical protein